MVSKITNKISIFGALVEIPKLHVYLYLFCCYTFNAKLIFEISRLTSSGIGYPSNNEHDILRMTRVKEKLHERRNVFMKARMAFTFSEAWVLHGKPCALEDFSFVLKFYRNVGRVGGEGSANIYLL